MPLKTLVWCISLQLKKGTYNKWLIPSNNNDNDRRRERADSFVFLPKKPSMRKLCLAVPHVQIIVQKNPETNPLLQLEGGVFTYENESIIAISRPFSKLERSPKRK